MTKNKPVEGSEQTSKTHPNALSGVLPVQEPVCAIRSIPQIGNPESTIMIGGRQIEIKPTKQRYQRNRTAMFYKMLELYPLTDILAMDAGTFGDDRDGDKAVMDWLIAVTDDPEQIVAHYDEMDTGTIERLLDIFRRVNRIDEKEAKQKNALAARKE